MIRVSRTAEKDSRNLIAGDHIRMRANQLLSPILRSTCPDKKGQARTVPRKTTPRTYQEPDGADQHCHTSYEDDHRPPRSCKIGKRKCWTAEADRLAKNDLAKSVSLVIPLWLAAIYGLAGEMPTSLISAVRPLAKKGGKEEFNKSNPSGRNKAWFMQFQLASLRRARYRS